MYAVPRTVMARESAPPSRVSSTSTEQIGTTEGDRPRVLLIEDNPADARLVAIYLADQGLELVHARTLAEAQKILSEDDPFAAILLDLRLPDSTARSSVEVIREITSRTPIVVVSALEGDETVHACLEAGAQDYIRKGEMSELILARVIEHAIVRANSQEIQRRLERSEQHAVVGRVAAGVAHEVNNLAVVLLALGDRAAELVEALRGQLPAANDALLAELAAVVREESDGLRRIGEILRELQLFSRTETDGEAAEEPAVTDVGDVVRRTVRLMEGRVRQTARLTIRCAPAPLARISERKLGQILLNLVNNALDAIDGPVDDNEVAIIVSPRPGGVTVDIRDTGCGIPQADQRRVFEPFFTTKGRGKGTGLGLAVCRELIEGIGGSLVLESEVGRGTTVRIELPEAGEVGASREDERPEPARRRLLVIDDDRRVRRILVRQLTMLGHEVVEAGGGGEALALLATDDRFDAVLCDLMMPDVDGIAVWEAIRADHPQLTPHVALMSGGAYTARARAFIDETDVALLAKPFSPSSLGAFLDELAAR